MGADAEHVTRPESSEHAMKRSTKDALRVCPCPDCRREPDGDTAVLHAAINRLVAELDEKNRRRFSGLLASQLGRGGVQLVATVTGMSRTTILRGRSEIEIPDLTVLDRVRASGGGRKPIEKKTHGL